MFELTEVLQFECFSDLIGIGVPEDIISQVSFFDFLFGLFNDVEFDQYLVKSDFGVAPPLELLLLGLFFLIILECLVSDDSGVSLEDILIVVDLESLFNSFDEVVNAVRLTNDIFQLEASNRSKVLVIC